MRTESNDYSNGLNNDPWAKAGGKRLDDQEPASNISLSAKNSPAEAPDTDELAHLNFSESVKIMSEAMKMSIRNAALSGDAQSLGADDAKGKPGQLGDLLKALKSVQQSGDLEKTSQATVARLI